MAARPVVGAGAPWLPDFLSSRDSLRYRSAKIDTRSERAAAPTPGPSGPVDSDGDGMPDSWEMANGFNKNNPGDAAQDADTDGMTNLEEYLAGTDPRHGGSVLEISARVNDGVVELRFTAVAGYSYTIVYCNALPSGGSWQALTSVPPESTTHTVVVADAPGTGGTQRFYRVMTP